MESPRQSWLVWQLLDSAFPVGGFAHSGGLEAAWQGGGLRSKVELETFLRINLEQQGRSMLPLVRETLHQPTRFNEIDLFCHSLLSNPVSNRASRMQGQALVSAAIRCLGCTDLESTRSSWDHSTSGHFAPAFGLVLHHLDIPFETAGPMYLFVQVRGWISAAVRLNIIGPFEAQKIQANLGEESDRTWHRCHSLQMVDSAQTSPLLELWQAHHGMLYSRLFQS